VVTETDDVDTVQELHTNIQADGRLDGQTNN